MIKREIVDEHILPHRAWIYLYEHGKLPQDDCGHILSCERCLRLFLLCLKEANFGAVLKALDEDAA